jgi:hypothetical protein
MNLSEFKEIAGSRHDVSLNRHLTPGAGWTQDLLALLRDN